VALHAEWSASGGGEREIIIFRQAAVDVTECEQLNSIKNFKKGCEKPGMRACFAPLKNSFKAFHGNSSWMLHNHVCISRKKLKSDRGPVAGVYRGQQPEASAWESVNWLCSAAISGG
jgi:hypothetical protein